MLALKEKGIEVFSSRKPEERSSIVSLAVPGDVKAIVKRCKEEGVVINHRAGRLRVSSHCYNTTDELDRFMDVAF